MAPSRPLPDGRESTSRLQCSAAGALSHDFVVEDAKISSTLSQTTIILVGQPRQQSEHVIVSVGNWRCVPETLAGRLRGVGFQEEAAAASHVLMLKQLQGAHSPETATECLATMRRWAACTCTVSISSDPDADEAPRIQSVSRQFAQETGHSASNLLDSTLTELRLVRNCVSGECQSDTDKQLASKGCDVLFYRQTGEPWIANVRAIRCPAPPEKTKQDEKTSQETSASNSEKKVISCLLSIANITAASCPTQGDITLGRVLGSGAFGTVHIGKQRGHAGLVAVKVVNCRSFRDLRDLDAMRNEIAVMATLRHPHIIDLLDSAYVDDRIFIVLEFAPGGDLKHFIAAQEGGRLQEQEGRRIFGQCVSALAFCQRKRICHRDLKPENILLDVDQNVKIADFGLASIVTPGCDHLQYCGTPAFSAPELFGGAHYEVNPADIWSLGVVLYECLCGELPFRGSGQAALVKQIRSGKYKSLPDTLSADVKDLVSKMLIVDPEERATIDEIMAHDWYLPPTGASSGALSKDLTLLPPEDTMRESSIDGCTDNQEKDESICSPMSQASPSGSRHLKHLHSSVLVTFDESDLVSSDGSSTDSEISPPPHQTGACMTPEQPSKVGSYMANGASLQELKPAVRKSRTAHFADSGTDGSGLHASKELGYETNNLPKLRSTKRSVSLIGGVATGASAGNCRASGDVNKSVPTRLPSVRQARTASVSSPGEINGVGDKKSRPQKASAPIHGIVASR